MAAHRHAYPQCPRNLQGLIYIDYLFHVPLMITVALLAYCFVGDRDVRSENA